MRMLSVAAGMMALVQVLCLAQRPPPMPASINSQAVALASSKLAYARCSFIERSFPGFLCGARAQKFSRGARR